MSKLTTTQLLVSYISKVCIFSLFMHYAFWILVVPIGISCCANAINMAAGYNGLETGQLTIISLCLAIISIINSSEITITMILLGITGSSFGLYQYNKYPAKTFVGDVATLGFGSLIAACVVMSNIILYGIICILPTFYELYATIKYSVKGVERRSACMNPILDSENYITPPKGTEDYTLAFLVLSKKPMKEASLSRFILFLYVCSGFLSISISILV